jgi:cell division protein FtsQ
MARSAAHAARLSRSRRRRGSSASPRRTSGARRAGRPRAGWRRVWLRRAIAVGALGSALAAGYMLWLRDSSLVAVREVSIVGIGSAERDEVSAALAEAARGMTTLHVREDELREVAARYPTVRTVSADASFPNGLTIEVTEREPVALVDRDGKDLPVAGDGTVLPGAATAELDLPALEAQAEPSATRLVDDALEQARVLGAAPGPMRPLIEKTTEDAEGVGVVLTDGITLLFGDAGQADAKWAAAARVLADDELGGLSYIDLRAPDRPAVGGAAPVAGAS